MVEHLKTLGVKAAITVLENTPNAIEQATTELITEIFKQNDFTKEDIATAIFTLTGDLNAAFPAKTARLNFNWIDIPMICTQELAVPNSLQKCLRIMITINTYQTKSDIKHIYLKGAKVLRQDLT